MLLRAWEGAGLLALLSLSRAKAEQRCRVKGWAHGERQIHRRVEPGR
jgi:hypothetical protein